MRYKLREIEVFAADFRDIYDLFLQSISYPNDKNLIDVDKLLRVLEFYQKKNKIETL